jgi:protein-tyrosine kinase
MGRIDEALRRSAGSTTVLSPVTSRASMAEEVFVSPWAFPDGVRPAGSPSLGDQRATPGGAVASSRVPPLVGSELRPVAVSDAWMERLVIAPNANPSLVEQFRLLAATLHHAQTESNMRVVMMTSATAAEGKSLTIVNLALTLSQSYRQRVLLIDADLRRPSLHEVAGIPNTKGLGETLKSTVEQKLPVYQLSDTLIDAPPIAPIVDSSLLAANIDAAIMVVRAGRTRYADVKRAIDALGRDRILGVVLNGADEADQGGYQPYYHTLDSPAGG